MSEIIADVIKFNELENNHILEHSDGLTLNGYGVSVRFPGRVAV